MPKLIPHDEAAHPFQEKQLRQPKAIPDLPQITNPDALEAAREWLKLDAEIAERQAMKDALRDALADSHAPDEGMSVQIGGVIVSRYHRKGTIQWAKFAPKYLPADVDPEDFRAKGTEVVSARRA